MAEIEGLVRALREGDDAAKTAAARALGNLIHNDTAYAWVAIPEAGGIPPLVDLLRDGSADAQFEAAGALCSLACYDENTQALIAEAGAIPLLVDLLRHGSAESKEEAACALRNLTCHDNQVLIAEAGGIPPLVELLRDGHYCAKVEAAGALDDLAFNNAANKVLIAEAGAIPRSRRPSASRRSSSSRGAGRVTVDDETLVSDAGIAAKRKAALVVAELLRACVPAKVRNQTWVRYLIRRVIGPYL
ncbi:ubiquitin-protein transferase [Aureococcus anophagefferens]|nr:ubiquitin-protein transferase [Aureococcus anophagefferens]